MFGIDFFMRCTSRLPSPTPEYSPSELFSGLNLKPKLLYFLLNRSIRRAIELLILFKALLFFAVLVYLHVNFLKTPSTCLNNMVNDWPRDGVLRVEIVPEEFGYDNFYMSGLPFTDDEHGDLKIHWQSKWVSIFFFIFLYLKTTEMTVYIQGQAQQNTLNIVRFDLCTMACFFPFLWQITRERIVFCAFMLMNMTVRVYQPSATHRIPISEWRTFVFIIFW